jgi:hypothetical protein
MIAATVKNGLYLITDNHGGSAFFSVIGGVASQSTNQGNLSSSYYKIASGTPTTGNLGVWINSGALQITPPASGGSLPTSVTSVEVHRL